MISKHQRLEQSITTCARCGFCRARCPIYLEKGWESYAPIGKIAIAKQRLNSGWQADQAERIFRCTLCGNCSTACPVDLDLRETWLDMRIELQKAGKGSANITPLFETISKYRNISGEANENRTLWAENIPDLSLPFLKPSADLIYFVGCVASLYPMVSGVPQGFAQILDKLNVNYSILGGEEWCCGFPLLSAGANANDAIIHQLASHNVNKVHEMGARTVVTACPSCYHVWKEVNPSLVDGFDLEVLHSTDFLNVEMNKSSLRQNSIDRIVTYHDPCDLGRLAGIFDEPRRLIQAIPGLQLVEMKHHGRDALCCGGGGDLEIVDPQLSAAIARKRLDEAIDTGAQAIVTACQQCKRTLLTSARKNQLRLKVLDIGELIWESIAQEGN